jgi:hypothetical protein
VETVEGTLAVARLVLEVVGKEVAKNASARLGSEALPATLRNEAGRRIIDLLREIKIAPEQIIGVLKEGEAGVL